MNTQIQTIRDILNKNALARVFVVVIATLVLASNLFFVASSDTTMTPGSFDDGGADWSGGSFSNDWSGGSFTDDWSGSASSDAWSGSSWNDTDWSGGSFADDWSGSSGSDAWSGSSWNNDDWSGGSFNDDWSSSTGNNDWSGGSFADDWSSSTNNDDWSGGSFSDNWSGGTNNDDWSGGSFSDNWSGGNISDNWSGGSFNENFSGGSISDNWSGGSFNDNFSGGSFNDNWSGGSFADNYDGRPMDDNYDGRPMDDRYDGTPINDRYDGRPINDRYDGTPINDRYQATARSTPSYASGRVSYASGSYGSSGSAGGMSWPPAQQPIRPSQPYPWGGSLGLSSGGGYSSGGSVQQPSRIVAQAYPSLVPYLYPQPQPQPQPIPQPAPQPVCTISLSQTSVAIGSPATLYWNVQGANSQQHRAGIMGIGQVAFSGSRVVRPGQGTHTFTLEVRNNQGVIARCSATLLVERPQPIPQPIPRPIPQPIPQPQPIPGQAPVCSLRASTYDVAPGQQVILSWAGSSNATSATLSGFGGVPLIGTRTVAPQVSTTYAYTVSGPTGSRTCTAEINVQQRAVENPGIVQRIIRSVFPGGVTQVASPIVYERPVTVERPIVVERPVTVQRPVIVERPVVVGGGSAAGGTPRVSVNNTTFLPLETIPLKEGAVPATGFEDMILPFFMIASVLTAFYAVKSQKFV